MNESSQLKDLFRKEKRQELLRPNSCKVYSSIRGTQDLKQGDHIAVFTGNVFHHGIYLGGYSVAHLVSDSTPAIQKCSLEVFIAMGCDKIHICLMSYDNLPDKIRDAITQLSLFCLKNPTYHKFMEYNAIDNNCEHFVTFIITGGNTRHSFQVSTIGKLVDAQLKESKNQFNLAHTTQSSNGGCDIM
jgi:hypothetical protein